MKAAYKFFLVNSQVAIKLIDWIETQFWLLCCAHKNQNAGMTLTQAWSPKLFHAVVLVTSLSGATHATTLHSLSTRVTLTHEGRTLEAALSKWNLFTALILSKHRLITYLQINEKWSILLSVRMGYHHWSDIFTVYL